MIEFFHMGGYGFYVWMSMGMTALLMLGDIFFVRQQRKQLLKQIKRMNRLDKNRQTPE